jgi:hypothetical protein
MSVISSETNVILVASWNRSTPTDAWQLIVEKVYTSSPSDLTELATDCMFVLAAHALNKMHTDSVLRSFVISILESAATMDVKQTVDYSKPITSKDQFNGVMSSYKPFDPPSEKLPYLGKLPKHAGLTVFVKGLKQAAIAALYVIKP